MPVPSCVRPCCSSPSLSAGSRTRSVLSTVAARVYVLVSVMNNLTPPIGVTNRPRQRAQVQTTADASRAGDDDLLDWLSDL